MKATLSIAAIPLLAFIALGQDPAPQTATPTKPDAKQDSNAKTSAQTQNTAEMKTQSYAGTLMDASCATTGAATGAATGTATAESAETTKTTKTTKMTGDANRTATDQGQSCPVSASTAQFALKLKDGHVVKLDDVGNQRAQEALKNKKKWTDDAAANKPIHASVSGVLNGDQLLVMSIR